MKQGCLGCLGVVCAAFLILSLLSFLSRDDRPNWESAYQPTRRILIHGRIISVGDTFNDVGDVLQGDRVVERKVKKDSFGRWTMHDLYEVKGKRFRILMKEWDSRYVVREIAVQQD